MSNEKGPNIKKKQKCKNCEGKAGEKGRQCRQMPALQGTACAERRTIRSGECHGDPSRVDRVRCGRPAGISFIAPGVGCTALAGDPAAIVKRESTPTRPGQGRRRRRVHHREQGRQGEISVEIASRTLGEGGRPYTKGDVGRSTSIPSPTRRNRTSSRSRWPSKSRRPTRPPLPSR